MTTRALLSSLILSSSFCSSAISIETLFSYVMKFLNISSFFFCLTRFDPAINIYYYYYYMNDDAVSARGEKNTMREAERERERERKESLSREELCRSLLMCLLFPSMLMFFSFSHSLSFFISLFSSTFFFFFWY
jgi:hypothetical protein